MASPAQAGLRLVLTARCLAVPETEIARFEALCSGLLAELDPQGAIETLVFNELLHAAWNLHRFRLLEAEAGPDSLDRVSRFQARAQRAFYRALQELRTLQTNRALRAFKLAEEEQAGVPAIADINELTKQTCAPEARITSGGRSHLRN